MKLMEKATAIVTGILFIGALLFITFFVVDECRYLMTGDSTHGTLTGVREEFSRFANSDTQGMKPIYRYRCSYSFDADGRRSSWTRYEASTPTQLATGLSAADDANFAAIRTEATIFDTRGRVLHEASPEGTLSYDYDAQGRMTYTAINATVPPVTGSIGTPADPTTADRVTYNGYDILGRLVSVTEDATPSNTTDESQVATDYDFDLQGRMRAMATGTTHATPSVLTVMEYDRLGRLDVMTDTDADGNTLASYGYTVRADGKRTASTETFWVDENEDGEQTANELKANSYSWTYDSAGRLTDEAIDHWDNNFDQTESYQYDLTGNRTSLDRDKGNDSTIDEAITYSYDANDRLLEETLDSLTGTDTTTSYGYYHTQQTSKVVTAGSVTVSGQSFTFDLQGRLSTVVNDGYENGTLNSRERTTYEYDMRKYRVQSMTETGTTLSANLADETWSAKSSVEFLASHYNHTGYAQTLRETRVENGNTLTIDYTFGNDEIAQRTVERDTDGNITSDQTHIFGHDGHGSVRVLYDLAATAGNLIDQIATYSAYGVMIAMHSGNGTASPITEFKSTLTYSGEAWDNTLNKGYNRARWYDATTGTWDRLDDFRGNIQDPQSLHKYAYVHGDPIGGVDPTGEFAISVAVSVGIGVANNGRSAFASYTAKQIAQLVASTATGASLGAIVYHAIGKSAVRGSVYGAQLGAGIFIAHRRDGFSVVNRTLGRGKHFYLRSAIEKGSSAALGALLQGIIGQGKNFIQAPNRGFNQKAAFATIGTKAFESFSQGVFAEATGVELKLPVGLQLLDAFISSIASDLTDALIKGEKIEWGPILGDASRLVVIQGMSALATEMGVGPAQHAAITANAAVWLDNAFEYAEEFGVIDAIFSYLD